MMVHDVVHVLLQEFTEDASEGDRPIVPRIRQFVGLWDRNDCYYGKENTSTVRVFKK